MDVVFIELRMSIANQMSIPPTTSPSQSLKSVGRVLSFVGRHPAFALLDTATLEQLSTHMKQQDWDSGATIISYGEIGDRYASHLCLAILQYLFGTMVYDANLFCKSCKQGCAQVLSEFDTDCDTIKPGEWFGEVAPFQNVARTAFVKAKEPCQTYMISKQVLTEVLKGCPSLLEEINGTSKKRMQMYLERSILA
ncbi:hypothetical protein BATDEDRAFT_21960 [Batrachochytrium dendrobatidis JAM81]|uniref:Cyclic nucleotide-binding domain-containing protein n=1 Tax=Batrachochytrium dendrobatidis (strain JAM81 / FGSC 10211) TaxID=684364 RepID=F4NRI6_BATDJ|nr:uncharacterized protein BATDEDRAFT_21960 [Batrachochytrium dendrobatidis JAM81]EGF83348.1 hypothetical protein BATDEDRAFT_21960 [Batrachochytrium dendrobatidis JAM81]|eukprot:XP_006675428.1 hypothetical protein BATDEDRAFT_21960 [Batrachochytrium dendrobatidis JAM81]